MVRSVAVPVLFLHKFEIKMWRGKDYTPTDGNGNGDDDDETLIYGTFIHLGLGSWACNLNLGMGVSGFMVILEEGSNLITIKLFHGVGFLKQNTYIYVEGEVEFFDHVDSTILMKEGLETLVDRTKYCRPHKLYFKDAHVERHGGYRVIGGDEDVYDLVSLKNESGTVEVFRLAVNEFNAFMKKD
ncbi:OLC1v1001077C1 [Oldenlandia corymbosa var. corymbosa]|uniref:OLC1v1001077C1 n=1 Tax=Oldenlandia corymbosa var. corymbosa TaxID=529605 RepID=A0AAV1D4T4_OLDCO|nr:OLC1v1001077C1 [Oldenlandia corymbosa var. corymbosa]